MIGSEKGVLHRLFDLTGRVALITGGSRGLGLQIAEALGEFGATVVLAARTQAELDEAVAHLAGQGVRAHAIAVDLSQPDAAAALADEALARAGRIDILVNNAALRRETRFEDLDLAEWREVLGVILDGAFICAKAALPWLRESGGGSIINLGGMSAHAGTTDRAHVVAAKSGVIGLTRALAHDLAPYSITANCVVPGLIETVRTRSGHGSKSLEAARVPLAGRKGRPDEVASMVRYLAGPQARYVTGQTIHINGGAFLV